MSRVAVVTIGYNKIVIKNWKEFMGELERGQPVESVYGELGEQSFAYALEKELDLTVHFVDESRIFKGTAQEFRAAQQRERDAKELRETPLEVEAVRVEEVPMIEVSPE